MDAIEILGGLLGRKTSDGSSKGGKILKDILFGGAKKPEPQAQSPGYSPGGRSPEPRDINSQAKELEDLLNVAKNRGSGRTVPAQPHTHQHSSPHSQPQYPYAEKPDPRFETTRTVPAPRNAPAPTRSPAPPQNQNDQALIMIRAMINAAKADGEVSREEQQAIIEQLGSQNQEAIDFLRREFSTPLDVRGFAWSVPQGLEQQVYSISLLGAELNTEAEANYLLDLAHGLRISPDLRRQIHQHYGAPQIEG